MFPIADIATSQAATIDLQVLAIVVRSTIAIALAALACKLLYRQSAALRHRVLVFGLAAALIVPITARLTPQFSLHMLPNALVELPSATANPVRPQYAGSALERSPSASNSGIAANSSVPQSESSAQSNTRILTGVPSVEGRSEQSLRATAESLGMGRLFLFLWLTGTTSGSILFLISLIRQSIRLSELRRIDDCNWCKSVATAAKTLGLQRPIVTLESDGPCVPAVIGILRPRLLVPCNWQTWSQTQRRCILLHELAHVKRRDIRAQLLGRLAVLAYWFNPLVWHAVRQMRAERELASDDCVLLAGQTASDYAEQLLRTLHCYRPGRTTLGVAMGNTGRLDQRVLAILDPQRRRAPVGSRFAIALPCIVGVICIMLGGVTLIAPAAIANPAAEPGPPVWKESYAVEYPGTLPVSVAYSADGKMLLTGDTAGEIMALIFTGDEPQWRWKSKVGGSHAAVAFSLDQKKVYATTEHGVRILDAARGEEEARIEERDSNPTSIGVFPDRTIAEDYKRSQIVFGTPRGYFIKSWAQGKLPESIGTIQTSTVAKGAKPLDAAAVPLAVDPNGRSAIMTGPIDATGEVGGVKGKNVLWAYVCGNYEEGSPGNRVMPGHKATVVSAAWSKEGSRAVTGDATGRVIVWDAKTMKETGRLELGGRVAALAISDDGSRTAAYVLGKQGEVFVWETMEPPKPLKPIHTELSDFSGQTTYASLSFSPDGTQLAGCASDRKWLNRLGELIGKVRVWEFDAEPKSQAPPRQLYSKALPSGNSSSFVILNNHSILMRAGKQGAVDFLAIRDGGIQVRMVLGEFRIGEMKLSTDRSWLAIEQYPQIPADALLPPSTDFDVGVWDMKALKQLATISSCSQLLDVAANSSTVAVVRDNQIELWDVTSTKLLKEAPFKHTRLDAAAFSPDGKLIAVSDRNDLVLWRWEENTHERIDLGRRVGSLTFSPDGKFLAEGPTPREDVQIRDVGTRKVVRSLANGANRSMNVPEMAYSQGGRVLIACDNITFENAVAVPHRIHLWDAADGSLAHQLAIPVGLPQTVAVSPNGRHLVTTIADGDDVSLRVWRLDGEQRTNALGPTPPASTARD